MNDLRGGVPQPLLRRAAALLGVTLATAGCALLRTPATDVKQAPQRYR
jgi:hypothetical protein